MKLIKNQKGQTGIEYLLVAVVLLAIIFAIAQPLKDALSTGSSRVKSGMSSTVTTT